MARLYVGTYTQPEDHVAGHGEGIYCFDLYEDSLAIAQRSIVRGIVNPSFLALNSAASRLYAVSETTTEHGKLFAYAVDKNSGKLAMLSHQSVLGAAPCYVSVGNHHALVANYRGGSVVVLPIDEHGGVGPASDHVVHVGSSVNKQRQEAPHPHAIVLDPAHRYALVPDLGADTVISYRYDSSQGRLEPASRSLRMHAGAGPRHLTFDRTGRFVYLINELDSTIMACKYQDGTLTALHTVAALPRSFTGTPSGADIHLHPSGRFLYASLRDINCIIRLRVHPDTGRLTGKAYAHGLGATPRNFAIDPCGRYLIVANQDSDALVVMAIDPGTGLLTPIGVPTSVPSPACAVIAS